MLDYIAPATNDKAAPHRARGLRAGIILLALAGCGGSADAGNDAEAGGSGAGGKADEVGETQDGVRLLDQGWDEALRGRMYHLTEGSRIIPYEWFMALEVPGGVLEGTAFASSSNLRTYGFLPDQIRDNNPDGLPVGFSQYESDLGVNCTTCHTSEMQVGDVTVRLDGASMLADFGRFTTELHEAVRATYDDPDELIDFVERVHGTDGDPADFANTADDVLAWLTEMDFRMSFAQGAILPGPGRLDGIGIANNETLCIDFGLPEACDTFNAPSIPGFVWGVGELAWVQSNGSVHSSIGRNVGQSMGTFGDGSLEEDYFGIGGASADIPMYNLVELDEGFTQLRAPNWNDPAFADLLPELDDGALERGREIYASTCAGCHYSRTEGPFTDANDYDKRFVEVPIIPLAEIGTDGTWLRDLLDEETFAHPDLIDELDGQYEDAFGTDDPNVPVNTATLREMVILAAIENFVLGNPVTFLQFGRSRFEGYRESSVQSDLLLGYRAQPLEGVAFTGPFLHNGSVRTLEELLLPSEEREAIFWTGGNTFDPVAVGYKTVAGEPNSYEFDASMPGNRNRGHEGAEYGTTLSAESRSDLLEYLRSL